jgi:hypothetical protein
MSVGERTGWKTPETSAPKMGHYGTFVVRRVEEVHNPRGRHVHETNVLAGKRPGTGLAQNPETGVVAGRSQDGQPPPRWYSWRSWRPSKKANKIKVFKNPDIGVFLEDRHHSLWAPFGNSHIHFPAI